VLVFAIDIQDHALFAADLLSSIENRPSTASVSANSALGQRLAG
jgi:hypothetical protein